MTGGEGIFVSNNIGVIHCNPILSVQYPKPGICLLARRKMESMMMVKIPWLMAWARMMMLSCSRISSPLLKCVVLLYAKRENTSKKKRRRRSRRNSSSWQHADFLSVHPRCLQDDDAAVCSPTYLLPL